MKNTIKKGLSALLLIATLAILTGVSGDIGSAIAEFKLRNVDGKMVSMADYPKAKGFIVIFTCNHCPFAKLYSKRLNDLNTKYSALNVPLIAINSMDTLVYEDESFAKMKSKAKKDAYNFPYLQDDKQVVGKNFDAEHTPEAYVIWKENNQWTIQYKGAIDDNGEHPEAAKPYIGNAVDELLLGNPVSNPVTESFGCRIFYREQ